MSIRVMVVEPDKPPYVLEIPNGLKAMQDLVGGYIETVTLSGTAVLVRNEYGKFMGLKPNRMLNNDMLAGTFFVSGYRLGEFISISPQDIEKYETEFDCFLIM